jgi:hypothetical protein
MENLEMKAIGISHAFVWLAGLLVAGSIAAYTGAVAVAQKTAGNQQ